MNDRPTTLTPDEISNLSRHDRFAYNIAIGNFWESKDLPNMPRPPTYEVACKQIAMYLMQHYEPKAEGKQP